MLFHLIREVISFWYSLVCWFEVQVFAYFLSVIASISLGLMGVLFCFLSAIVDYFTFWSIATLILAYGDDSVVKLFDCWTTFAMTLEMYWLLISYFSLHEK